MFMCRSLQCGDVNAIIYNTDAAHEGPYGGMQGPIWVHAGVDIGSCERAAMNLQSRAVSVQVTKHFVTIFVKHVIMPKYNNSNINGFQYLPSLREHSGSMVECLTRDRGAVGWRVTGVTALCP